MFHLHCWAGRMNFFPYKAVRIVLVGTGTFTETPCHVKFRVWPLYGVGHLLYFDLGVHNPQIYLSFSNDTPNKSTFTPYLVHEVSKPTTFRFSLGGADRFAPGKNHLKRNPALFRVELNLSKFSAYQLLSITKSTSFPNTVQWRTNPRRVPACINVGALILFTAAAKSRIAFHNLLFGLCFRFCFPSQAKIIRPLSSLSTLGGGLVTFSWVVLFNGIVLLCRGRIALRAVLFV